MGSIDERSEGRGRACFDLRRGFLIRMPIFLLLILIAVFPVLAQQGTSAEGAAVSLSSEISRLERLTVIGGGEGNASAAATQEQRRNAFLGLIGLHKLSGNSEAALKICESALAAFPGNEHFILEQGQLLFSMGEHEKAVSLFDTLKNSGNRELAKQGQLLAAKLEAFRSSTQVLISLADDPDFTAHKSDIYYTLWKLTSNASWKNKLVSEFPQSPEAKLADGGIGLSPSLLWLLFPGRESVSLAPAVQQTVVQQTVMQQTAVQRTPVPQAATQQTAAQQTPVPQAAAQQAPVQTAPGSFLQTGLFGREENARALADRLRKAGFEPHINPRIVNGNNFWAVVVSGGADVNATIKKLKDAGFESFPVAKS